MFDEPTRIKLICPREKRLEKSRFDLSDAIHGCEYENLKRPIDPRTRTPIKPAHKFEVSLEPASFTEEKSLIFTFSLLYGID